MRIVREAELVAAHRIARHELGAVLGGPSRWHHRRADELLDRLDELDTALHPAPDVVLRWNRRRAA